MSGQSGYLGPYELRGELGRGAMARVWRAWDPNLEREVAIKEPMFDPRLSEDVLEEMGRRFVKEGRAAARLDHPGIVTIYAADVYDGRPAIVMELVDGPTLGKLLESGPLDPPSALDVLDQLLDAIGYAHDHGVVHRDIKPENIFIASGGRVKLADFGIAHIDDGNATRATMVGTVLGTPGYMSPEQATGAEVDARSDLFSVGVVGYEMLTGRNPFGAGEGTDSTTLLYRIVHEPAPAMPGVVSEGLPDDLRPAVMLALSKSPADRPQNAAAFKAMLHGGKVPTGTGPSSLNATTTSKTGKGASGKLPSWLPYVAVAGVAAVILFFLFMGANSSNSGGAGGGAVSGNTVSSSSAESGSSATNGTSGASNSQSGERGYYLGISDGHVAAFYGLPGDGSSPVEVYSVEASELNSDTQSTLSAGVAIDSLDDAEDRVDEYREEASWNAAPVFTSTSSSSTLPPSQSTYYYGPDNAIDGNRKTAWNEGVSGFGKGEWLQLSASEEQTVSGIRIMAGYPKTKEIYYWNNRPRKITLEFSDGSRANATLKDRYGKYQTIRLNNKVRTTYVRVVLKSVYSGNKYNDTAIAELEAF